jgi:hypothetical protein
MRGALDFGHGGRLDCLLVQEELLGPPFLKDLKQQLCYLGCKRLLAQAPPPWTPPSSSQSMSASCLCCRSAARRRRMVLPP